MARVKVLTAFKNKYTGALHAPGDILDITEERIEEIKAVADNLIEVIPEENDEVVKETIEEVKEEPKKQTTRRKKASE
jgi:vacuolar-type H+-ATPase subunit E/Vma4|nr:MAG TPA: hypothetical protein [Caudoviricetes sp.]